MHQFQLIAREERIREYFGGPCECVPNGKRDWGQWGREAAILPASGALQANVIDLVARNPNELLQLIDGRTVELAGGGVRRLATKDLTIERLDPEWLIRLLSVITR